VISSVTQLSHQAARMIWSEDFAARRCLPSTLRIVIWPESQSNFAFRKLVAS
jgi:hypothetical protein